MPGKGTGCERLGTLPEARFVDWLVRDHTSLRAWQESHALSIEVILLWRSSWKPYAAALFGQLQRSSLSVQLGIAEGYTYGDSRTFTRHLGIADGSAVETGDCYASSRGRSSYR